MSRKGKAITLSTAAVGLAVLVTAGIVLRVPIQEEWYLRDLAIYDEARSKKAAEWFGQYGSVRAMRRLFDLARVLALRPDADNPGSGTGDSITLAGQALECIAVKRQREVVPLLVEVLKEQPPRPIPANEVRIGAANCLDKIGLDAHEVIPALQEALHDPEERFRHYAAEALKKIQEGQDDAPR